MSMGGGQQQGAPQLTQSQTAGNTSQNGSSTTNMGPWAAQQPFLQGGFGNAQSLLQNNSTPLAPNHTLQDSWTNMTAAAGNHGQSYLGPALQYNTNVLGGQFMSPNSNPYLAGMEGAAAKQLTNQYQTATAPQTDSSSEMANRYGSGEANQRTSQNETNLATGLGNLANNFYGGAYNTGINQMNQAASMAPTMLQSSFLPSQYENQVGQQQQQFQQAQQQYPWLTAQMYQNLVGGNYGQSGTTGFNQTGTSQGTMTGQQQQPYYSNPFGQIAGGVLSGLGTAGNLGWSPFGASAGADTGLSAISTAAKAAMLS